MLPGITGYRLHYGPAPGVYTHTIDLPGSGTSSYEITGLTDGVTCYVAVAAVNENGWESVVMTEESLDPRALPRVPSAFDVSPEYHRIELSWGSPVELDISHYEVYRGPDEASLTLYDGNVTGNLFVDHTVDAGVRYFYHMRAIDNTANPSDYSATASAIPATFDQGILLLDMTGESISEPPQQEQEDTYHAMFTGYPHGFYQYDDYDDPLDKSELGQYETVFWIDDDLNWERWTDDHWAKLDWYMNYGNNVVIAGWQTPNEIVSGSFLYDVFHVSGVSRITAADCLGGIGEGGFPGVVFDTAKVSAIIPPWGGTMGQIWTLTPADGSTDVFFRYDSNTDDPAREALPVGVKSEYGASKMALLALPLYYLRDADAQAMIAALQTWFDMAPAGPGDLNADTFVDVLDLMIEIDVVFAGMFPPTGYANADVNATCDCNVLDIVYMIDYCYRGGPAPLEGCQR
jgi:hypothetical protein